MEIGMDPKLFIVAGGEALKVQDSEISQLLDKVYVQGGFTAPDVAQRLFAPAAVKARGVLIAVRHRASNQLAGMVILGNRLKPGQVAGATDDDESELHLLAVDPEFRSHGIGHSLVSTAIEVARNAGATQMVLCTQSTMHSAHRLYERLRYQRIPHRDFVRRGRQFLVYELRF